VAEACDKRGEARGAGKAVLLKTTINALYLSERRQRERVAEVWAKHGEVKSAERRHVSVGGEGFG